MKMQPLLLLKDNQLILNELRRFPRLVALAVFSVLMATLSEGVLIWLLSSFIRFFTQPENIPVATGLTWLDSSLFLSISRQEGIYRIAVLLFLSVLTRSTFAYVSHIYLDSVRVKLIHNLRLKVLDQIQNLSMAFINKSNIGELSNTITTEISSLQQVFQHYIYLIIRVSSFFLYLASAILISWQISAIAFVSVMTSSMILSKVNAWVREASFPVSTANGKMSSVSLEIISGLSTIHAFSTNDFERRRFSLASQRVVETTKKAVLRLALAGQLSEILSYFSLIFLLVISANFFVGKGVIELPSLLTLLFILTRLTPSIREINNVLANISSFSGSIRNIDNFLSKQGKDYLTNGTKTKISFEKSIEFRDVSFSYIPESPVLHNINLSVKKGQTVALVGASGSGKTTLASLLLRFYDPISGGIYIDNNDLRLFDIHSLRNKMAIVSQDTFIFNTSIRENIAYGIESPRDEDIIAAAKLSNSLEFINEMPEGLDTQLGDKGVRLSGGQRQRISIARALLRDPEILILDEATSALDSSSEKLIQNSIEKLSQGRTVISIAHRLSTIIEADQVVVFEKGSIVEQGSYRELINSKGLLWRFHELQNSSSKMSLID